jgi:hypothetical protein
MKVDLNGLRASLTEDNEALEKGMVNLLRSALIEIGVQPKVLCPIAEIGDSDWDIGAFAEVDATGDSDNDICFRFAQDTQTSNVYVSVNGDCYDFGQVDIRSIMSEQLIDALKSIL